jgi:nucleotide-binding universal stress UspA family protein
MIRVNQILVPTDFSPTSDLALDYAREIAQRFGASLHLLHVLEDPFVHGPFASDIFIDETADVRRAILEEAKARLARRVRRREGEVAAASAEIVSGHSAATIVTHARELGADLIVMGTHGRTGLAHLLIGSVAERVFRTSPCPVMTVRMPVAAEPIRLPETLLAAVPA